MRERTEREKLMASDLDHVLASLQLAVWSAQDADPTDAYLQAKKALAGLRDFKRRWEEGL